MELEEFNSNKKIKALLREGVKTPIPEECAIVMLGAYGDTIDFDFYNWYVEPYSITRIKDDDVFMTCTTFIISGEYKGACDGERKT